MANEKPRIIQANSPEYRELMALEKNDINLELMRNYFACFLNQEHPKFNTFDTLILPPKKFYNQGTLKTTVGRYLFNLGILPESYLKKYGYYNDTITKGSLGKLEDKMGDMVLDDEMDIKEYTEYLDRGEWLSMGSVYFLAPTMDYEINVPIKNVVKLRDELFEKYKDDIKKGDPNVANKIESELLALAKEEIKKTGNESYDYFESGVGSFENNYKKTSIMGGSIENPYTKKLDIVKSNYVDGIDKKEFPKFANLSLIGRLLATA